MNCEKNMSLPLAIRFGEAIVKPSAAQHNFPRVAGAQHNQSLPPESAPWPAHFATPSCVIRGWQRYRQHRRPMPKTSLKTSSPWASRPVAGTSAAPPTATSTSRPRMAIPAPGLHRLRRGGSATPPRPHQVRRPPLPDRRLGSLEPQCAHAKCRLARPGQSEPLIACQ